MSTISARTGVHRYRFVGTDGLYRDAHGHRVVADFEGAGFWRVEAAETSFLVLRDEQKTEAFQGSFAESLSVLALGPGTVSTRIWTGSEPPAPDAQVAFEGRYEGRGWIVAAEGEVTVDENHAPIVAAALPTPFFRCAETRRGSVIPLGPPARLVDAFRIEDAAAMKARGWIVQNVSRPTVLRSRFADGAEWEATVASHLNVASWVSPIPPDNRGLRLRKRYDRFHGRQRARVFVDGAFAGWWYAPEEDRAARWAVTEFGIPEELTHGRASVHLAIDPPAGSPLWSLSEMEVWAL